MNNTNKNPPSFESGFCLAPPAGLVQAKRLIIVLSNDVALSTSETSRRLAQAMTHDIRRGPERTSDNLHTAYAVSCVIRRVRPTNSKFTVRCTSLHRSIVAFYRLRKPSALSAPCSRRFRCVKNNTQLFLTCYDLATPSRQSTLLLSSYRRLKSIKEEPTKNRSFDLSFCSVTPTILNICYD